MTYYHSETIKIYNALNEIKPYLKGETKFTLANLTLKVEGKDGLGGLIEEWFGVWAETQGFNIENPKKNGSSQEFPDYYVWSSIDGVRHHLEIKSFDADASPNFDIANFQSYCESLASKPERVFADYLIFAYRIRNGNLEISDIYLKKIWEITCSSERWPLKTQTKRGIIYNIRPASFTSVRGGRYPIFLNADQFIRALFDTEEMYLNRPSENKIRYLQRINQS